MTADDLVVQVQQWSLVEKWFNFANCA